ncbi:uncharacterized protein LOC142802963 isoform X2 [Rhipicephalus microplus]|uniref:uncharacterized protein LOC142802963 isoform X2 n=1 Tax=Rhipicephalus microplus TaxID=6941 RepID=UPI003F6AF344
MPWAGNAIRRGVHARHSGKRQPPARTVRDNALRGEHRLRASARKHGRLRSHANHLSDCFTVTEHQGKQLDATLTPFSGMFTERPRMTDVLVHRINAGDAQPWRCNPRPLSQHKRSLLDKALDEMFDTRAARLSESPWAFPVVLAPKKDSTACLYVDYRKIDAVTAHASDFGLGAVLYRNAPAL